ncbi:glycosyltransferase [uncultured Cellulomonas sp.]|uniref:glycosyltransferase n=1 Tax=uncultured Cellulomonas sp. TaxID=189682 RepID=UPI0026060CF7|nr:glycosyltransferase [uncultured Cellulomonas sp.]
MRIVVVSSHFPPNFVSGGTLVPYRAALGLAQRGHEVFVYAGRIDPSSPDGEVTEERTADGLTIRWVTCTSATEWASDTNFSNGEVEADFAAYLQAVRPDVVHVHAIQGFGGGLVPLARAAGAAVVITMHDLWWWCARQFMVEPSMHACPVVPAAGVCPCARDNAWLQARNHRLAAQGRTADLVLTPSASMRRILVANGVDPARVQVDENGVPDDVVRVDPVAPGSVQQEQEQAPRTGPLRLMFAGGTHALKGGPLLLEAAARLVDRPGWELEMYGWEGRTVPAHLEGHVRFRAPYAPHEAAEVLAAHDALVLPSLARESYSLLTREALRAGLPVLTSDTPGPTEAVRDGVNGLIVPIGDVTALAAAMERLISEPTLLADLAPDRSAVRLRTVDEQVDANVAQYERLLAERSAAEAAEAAAATLEVTDRPLPPIRQVLLASGIGSAPLRYRGRLPQEGLALHGVRMDVRMYRDVDVARLARSTDALVLYRTPATEQVLDLVAMVRARPGPVPVLFDIDDLVVDPDLHAEIDPLLEVLDPEDRRRYWQGVRRYRTTLESADAFIGSTDPLCAAIHRLTGMPVHRFANGVGRHLAQASDHALRQPRRPGPLRIGYLSGTNTHNADWAFIEGAVIDAMQARPDLELWLGGLLDVSPRMDPYTARVRRLPLMSWLELPTVLRDLDVNLAPLNVGTQFNEAKSAIKHLEAALVETPTIASPTQPFREAIRHGATGYLAHSAAEWTELLLRLVDDAALRSSMGQRARTEVLLDLSPALQGRRYLQILQSAQADVAEHGHRPMLAGFTPETENEPFFRWDAEPYEGAPWLQAPGRPGEPAARDLRRIVSDYRVSAFGYLADQGVAATTVKVATVAGRLPARALRRLAR